MEEYKKVQNITKDTIEYIKLQIKPGMSLIEVRGKCEEKMLELGADSFWYWDVGAFIFADEETTLSVSGREYKTSNRTVKENDIITIDLSPQKEKVWGNYARTIIIEDGKVINNIKDINNTLWREGLLMEEALHNELYNYATPDTTFEQLYEHMNKYIVKNGFINLDFMGNLGHSIVREKDDRIYIEKGNKHSLEEVNYFTFEPHITEKTSKYGYKKENIYYFKDNNLMEL